MRCPLMRIPITRKGMADRAKIDECIKEECAWWEPEASCCAALLIPKHLYTLERMLGLILEKMPHHEQFKS